LVATPYDPLCLENIQGLQAPLEYHSIEPSLLTSVSNRAVGEGFLSTVQLDLVFTFILGTCSWYLKQVSTI
jgi:hypothetical protein